MVRLSLAAASPAPAAAVPAAALPDVAAATSPAPSVAILADDAAAAAAWRDALAAEGLALRGAPPVGTRDAEAPAAWLLHLSHGLAPQLARLRDLRAAWPSTPLVVACRQLRDLDHVLALEMGADDVLDAALDAPVVAARLRALWRRCARHAPPTPHAGQALAFGALELDLATRRAVLGGSAVALTEGEFEVLWLLAANAGCALSRREILRRVRGLDDHPTDRSIDSRVYRLRAKLGDTAQQRIRTVRHRGYLFSPAGW